MNTRNDAALDRSGRLISVKLGAGKKLSRAELAFLALYRKRLFLPEQGRREPSRPCIETP